MSGDAAHGDSSLLAIGQQCSHSTCMLVDFLPLKCKHCNSKFCFDHFQPSAHACTNYDAAAHDRIAPDCPLCGIPVAFAVGTDPNARMEQHFATDCSAMGHERKTSNGTPVCHARSCNKKLFAPIQCSSCRQKFCAEHRFASSHNCSPASPVTLSAARPGPQAAAALAALKRNLAATAKQAKASAASLAAKPSPGATPTPTRTTTPGSSSSQRQQQAPIPQPAPKMSKVSNPFSKTDRYDTLSSPLSSSATPTIMPSPSSAVQSAPTIPASESLPTPLPLRPDPLLGSWVPPRVFVKG